MGKVDTDQGLGPGSEDRRRQLLTAKSGEEAPASPGKRAEAGDALPPKRVDRDAETQPGVGKVERRKDNVDALLEGFGPSRPDLPRILPRLDTTPPPDPPAPKELTPTSPGKRQRVRNMVLAMLGTFVVIVAFGVGVVKLTAGGTNGSVVGTATATTTAKTPATGTLPTATTTSEAPVQVTGITTMQVEALPTATNRVTARVRPPPTTTATTTAATPTARPAGSAPPGMNLLPDDPHR